jgi:hypothetical protein
MFSFKERKTTFKEGKITSKERILKTYVPIFSTILGRKYITHRTEKVKVS